METGDFDQTPAPSGRPSLATLRPEEDHTTADASGIFTSRAAAFKHHLLKTSTSGPTLVDRDLPAPPVVSRSPPIKTPSQSSKSELENRGAVLGRPASALTRQSSPAHQQDKIAYSSPIRLVDRECVNTSLHKYDTHGEVHHPGLLEGADFCDNGIRSAGSRSFVSSTNPSSPISDISMMSGEMHRMLSSGDISVTEVTVPIHRHKGHSIAVKVRPAFSYYPVHHPVIFGGQHGLDYSRSANKAQPFDSGVHHPELTTRPNGNDVSDMEAAVPRREIFELEKEQDGIRGLAFPISKVRAVLPELRPEDDHQYYNHKVKVKPYIVTEDGVSRRHYTEEHHQYPPARAVGDFESVLSYSNKGSQMENEVVRQGLGAESPYQGRNYSPSEHPLIHSPIPVSKVRPIFTGQPSSSGHESHSSASKVGPVQRGPSVTATHDKPYFQMESVSNGSSARTHSLGSTLDYKRTAQWLREILKYPETYTSKFTELPPKRKAKRSSSAEQRRQSDTALSSILPSRRMTGLSSHSRRSEPKIDPLIFQRAVNDLEKLMNEAIALASEVVVQRPDTPSCPKPHQASITLHSRCHSVPGGQDGASQDDGTSGCTRESPGRFEDVDLHNDSQQKRPLYQHAATYTGAPERPRLNEILQNYSNTYENAAAMDFPVQKGASPQTAAEASFTVPGRRSSIKGPSYASKGPRKVSSRTQKLNRKKQYNDLAKETKDVFVQGQSRQNKSASRGSHARHASHESGEDDPPGREVASRRVHAEHGISLRRRSHVSLRGAQGFSLAKSRKRQPTARD
ncbi:hypothetical protein ACHAQJ_000657 [Trichoderma viride]